MNEDPQVHMHVIPRYASDRSWNGHRFTDPHWGRSFGPEQHLLDRAHILQLALEIRHALPPATPST